MDASPLRDALTLVLGVVTGVLSGLFGVGGATVSTPGIRALGATALSAVGTTLPSIFPSAVSGTARYVREKLVDWRVVAYTAPTGIVASVGGSLLSHEVPGDGHWLMIATAALLAYVAWRMARPGVTARPTDDADAPPATGLRRAELAMIGVAAGGMSGLLGVGGGVVMVPAFTEVTKLPLKTAIASSLLCVAAFAVPGTITHWALGDIDWRFAIPLAIGVIPGARLGAALAIKANDVHLRRIVALFLGLTALIYGTGELIALIR
jgi:uncharacterized membrane protein YfcA